jgi:flavin reductase (DIM6/NTAB) family NADH-FMN oxidoreductase RutF
MKKIDITEITKSPVELIGKQWMLISAGTPEAFNTMTASWGGLGFLWNRPVAFVFVRPNRHTVNFIEAHPSFTLSFMPEQYRQDLVFCGRNSGRDVDKMAHTSLVPATTPGGLPTFENAELVLECRRMFRTTLQEADFVDWSEVSPT